MLTPCLTAALCAGLSFPAWADPAAARPTAARAAPPAFMAIAGGRVPLVKAPSRALARRLAEPTQARQIGVGIALGRGLSDGAWTTENGRATWRLALGSDGAQAVALALSDLRLPAGATLTWASVNGVVTQGPYTAADVPASGVLFMPMVPGQQGVLTLALPGADTAGAGLTVRDIQHIYAMMPATEGDGVLRPKASGDTAGACNVDVVCPAGKDWSNEIRATVRYTIVNGANTQIFACSGSLLNNTSNSEDPLLYTANHCTTGNQPSSVVAYYNFQKAACNGPAMSATGWSQTQTGASLLASGTGSDYALLRMSARVPSAYNAYFNAWNAATSATASSGSVIHHPSADVKKISLYTTPASRVTINFTGISSNEQAWQVTWSTGTTEEGSSGSSLLNQNHQVVGTLSGGDGACSTSNPSQNNGQSDYFGRLDAAYAESAVMRSALDPATSGAATSAVGKTQSGATSSGFSGGTTGSGSSGGGGGGALGEGLLATLAAVGLRRRARGRSGTARRPA